MIITRDWSKNRNSSEMTISGVIWCCFALYLDAVVFSLAMMMLIYDPMANRVSLS